MSIRIIIETPSPEVEKRVVCEGCGITLAYVPNDVVVLWNGRDIGGGPDGARGFKCPKCNKDVIIDRW